MMSTANLILVLVLGGVFLLVVIFALFFWYRYMKMYNSSDEDDVVNIDPELGNNNSQRRQMSLIRAISCSNGNQHQETCPLNNLHEQNSDETNNTNNLNIENTAVPLVREGGGPPSYQDLRGSFQNINENEDPPSYQDVQHPLANES